MVIFCGPKQRQSKGEKKNNTSNKKNQISAVDVIHEIKEDGGAIFLVYDNTINGDVPIFVQ